MVEVLVGKHRGIHFGEIDAECFCIVRKGPRCPAVEKNLPPTGLDVEREPEFGGQIITIFEDVVLDQGGHSHLRLPGGRRPPIGTTGSALSLLRPQG